MASTEGLPRYAQIAAELRRDIDRGLYPEGSKIPSEHELCERFGVGRPTARQATELLVNERVLERQRGSGTYVRALPRAVDLFSAGGTLQAFAEQGVELETRLLGRLVHRSVPDCAGPGLAGRRFLFLSRLGRIERVPVLLEEMYFDPTAFAGLSRLKLGGRSLSALSREHFRLAPTWSTQRFALAVADPRRARRLGLAPGAPLLHVERCLDFEGFPAAFFAELYCRADRLRFSQRFALDGLGQPAIKPTSVAHARAS